MSSPQPGPSTAQSPPVGFDVSDIANYDSFMDSLITLMNESALTIQQVRERSGMSSGCTAPVRMNVEDRQQKMSQIVANLSESYKAEASLNMTTLDSTLQPSVHDTAFSLPSTPRQFRPAAASSPCSCPPDISQNLTPPSRQLSRGRRADTPRPGSTPVRGRVATPDDYFIPVTQSTMMSQPGFSSIGSSGASRSSARGRGRTQSPYSTLIDSGGLPDAYRSGTGAFDNLTSQSGRGLSSYSNNSPSDWSSGCPRECTVASINSTGRQQYTALKGQQNPWNWKRENRTI